MSSKPGPALAAPPLRRGARALAAIIGLMLVLATGASAAAPLHPCPHTKSGLQCATVDVPLDRAAAVPGTVHLAVRFLAAAQGPAQGTVFLLAGGPGQSATSVFGPFAQLVHRGLPTMNVATFDQRGTGRSGYLRCRALRGRGSPATQGGRCGRELGPRRGLYRTADSVEDLEAVRLAFGAPKLSVVAVSYGARVAGEYARRHPDGLARLVLDSPSALAGTDPFRIASERALPRVLDTLCAGACGFTRSASGDLARLAGRLRGGRTLRGRIVTSRARARRVRFSKAGLFGLVSSSDTKPVLRSQLPGAVSSALHHDAAPLLRLAARRAAGGAGAASSTAESNALLLATSCAEAPFPWDPASPPGKGRAVSVAGAVRFLGSAPFAPFGANVVITSSLIPLCVNWPAVVRPPVLGGPGPAVPTFVLSGLEDLRTPLEQAQSIAAQYPGAALLPVPYTGHSTFGTDLTDCAPRALLAFLGGAVPPAACPPARRPLSVAPRPPRRVSDLRPFGVRGRRGQTVSATVLTVVDAFRQVATSSGKRALLGGLRGGRLVLRGRTLILERYEYVPGARVSGRLRLGRGGFTGVVRVSGRGVVVASVRLLANGRVRARFGGRVRGASAATVTGVVPAPRVPFTRPLVPGLADG